MKKITDDGCTEKPICKACGNSVRMIYHEVADEWVCHGTHVISESELNEDDDEDSQYWKDKLMELAKETGTLRIGSGSLGRCLTAKESYHLLKSRDDSNSASFVDIDWLLKEEPT